MSRPSPLLRELERALQEPRFPPRRGILRPGSTQPGHEEPGGAVDVRQRLEELGSPRMPEPGPLVRERGVDLEPRRVDDLLGLLGVDRAHRVDDRPSLTHALRGCAKQLELELGERRSARQRRSGRWLSTPRPEQGASTSARSKRSSSGGRRRPSATTTRTSVAPSRRAVSSSSRARPRSARPRPPLPAASSPCRPARRRDREYARPRATRPRVRRAATRRSAARSGLRRAPPRRCGRRATLPGRPDRGLPGSLPRITRTTVSAGSF